MKLIHCADLHLDSPMESNLSAQKARERKNEILSTFSELVTLADRAEAAGILIAGDLFDSTRTSRKTEQYVLDLIAAHPNLYFFYLAGNHDSGNRLAELEDKPANLLTFGEGWTPYDFGEVYIVGSEKPNPELLELPSDRVNIVMLHGQKREGGGNAGDVIPFRKYQNRNIDYMALGHLHEYQEAKLDDRGIACYCGCLEGRGFDECGPKGYVLIEVDNGNLKHRFIPLARRTLHEVSCDITGCTSQLDAERRVLTAVEAIPQKDLVKVVLTGRYAPELLLEPTRLTQVLEPKFYFAKLKNLTRPEIKPEHYAHDISLKGEFVRRVMASDLPEEEKERIIACGFRALCGEELDV